MGHAIPAAVVLTVLAAGIAAIVVVPRAGEEDPAPRPRPAGLRDLAARLVRDYDEPARSEARALAAAFDALVSGDRARAAALARPLGYRVAGSRGELVLAPAARNRGWGVFAHAPDPAADVVVEVPHPGSDLYTEALGASLFAELRAQALLVAGAHREHVDVADDPDSAFAVVSARLARPGRVFVQLHGFDESDHDVGDAVVSSGKRDPDPAALRIARALRAAGHDVCLYRGRRCGSLAGRTNVERRAAQARGAEFVHVELARDLRDSEADRLGLARVLADGLRAGGPTGS